jgi:hypothetical protein
MRRRVARCIDSGRASLRGASHGIAARDVRVTRLWRCNAPLIRGFEDPVFLVPAALAYGQVARLTAALVLDA